jgi:hypothetical protein
MAAMRSRECRQFPAFTSGPGEYYGRSVVVRPVPVCETVVAGPPVSRPRNFVRLMPRYGWQPRAAPPAPASAPSAAEALAVAAALVVLPPVGVTLLWASPRFTLHAKIAVTAFVAVTLALAAVVAAAALLAQASCGLL